MTILRLTVILFASALLFSPHDLQSCGPFLPAALFTASRAPLSEAAFVSGRLGILAPGFRRFYLAMAYRYLTGHTLTPAESLNVTYYSPEIAQPRQPASPHPWDDPRSHWGQARSQVPGFDRLGYINPFKEDPSTHSHFWNCKDDSFAAATLALQQLVQRFGAESSRVHDWVGAQDQVFENCSAGPSIPASLPPQADASARADRDYQIAAAYFYSGDFDRARTRFASIGDDPASPWKPLGPYLVARCLIRQHQLGAAEKQLDAILQKSAPPAEHDRASHLLRWVRIRLYPAAVLDEAAHAIVAPHPNELRQSLIDYTYLYDTLEDEPGLLEAAAAKNDLTDWIRSFQSISADTRHCLDRWRASHSPTWLLCALKDAAESQDLPPDLLRAASDLPEQSPARLTALYLAAITLENSGHEDAARELLDRALSPGIPRDSENVLLMARTAIARNWTEFLRDAQRIPAGEENLENVKTRPDSNVPRFDSDATHILLHDVPLALISQAAQDRTLPASIRRALATAAWTRALLLADFDTALALCPALIEVAPELSSYWKAFAAAPPNTRVFEAVWNLLHNPGLRPYTKSGFDRTTPVSKLDNYADNWWPPLGGVQEYQGVSLYKLPAPHFLSASESAQAAAEWDTLKPLPSGPTWMGERALIWARANPKEPRVPETLHLVVRATRYGSVDEQASKFSKAAFDLLHRRYAYSEWARKTPYWF